MAVQYATTGPMVGDTKLMAVQYATTGPVVGVPN